MSGGYDFDLFVIGGGSGGVRAARVAAEMGATVALAEMDGFGGTCVQRGCIPKKLMVYASAFPEEFADAAGFGWTVPRARFDWQAFVAGKDAEIARIAGVYRRLLESCGVEIFAGRAVLAGPHAVRLTDRSRTISAKTILIATGGRPSRVAAAGAEGCITSDEAFHLKERPESIVIIGAGYIAVEFAHIFHGLGSEVTLIHRGPRLLRGFDDDLSLALLTSMQRKGIRVVLDTVFLGCERAGEKVRAITRSQESFIADQVMLAIGRQPNTRDLGLDQAGVALTERGHVIVDRFSRSTVESIYAIGDCTGRIELTPVALHEAMCFARTAIAGEPTPVDYTSVPTAVFTRPEIGAVGLTEAAALAQGYSVDIYKTEFRPLKNTLSGRSDRSLMKLVVDARTDKVLGCHIFGPEAGEMVQLVAIALKVGVTKAAIDATIAVHPTMAEELVTIRTKFATRSPPARAADPVFRPV